LQKRIEPNEGEKVFLPGILSEFRTALLHEIDAATANVSSSAVPLINGRKIAQVGGSYQYIFDVENALNLPGDTPGDLYIPGRNPIEVVVISIEGMAIILGIPENLGKFIPNAKLKSNLAFLMRKLIERIESKANFPNHVGDRILGNFNDEESYTTEIIDKNLNKQQRIAIASSIERDITFIWGPPGTGKTRTIGSIGKELYLADRTALLVSHTNTAVDGAINIIGKFIDEELLVEGKVIRVGQPKDRTLDKELLLSTHVDRRSAELANKKATLEVELSDLTKNVKDVSKKIDICEWTVEAASDISSMEKELSLYHSMNRNLDDAREELVKHESLIPYWGEATREATIAQSHLIKISRCEGLVTKLEHKKDLLEKKLFSVSAQVSEAKSLLTEVENLSWVIRKWRRLPSPEEQSEKVRILTEEFGKLGLELDDIKNQMEKAHSEFTYLDTQLQEFRNKYHREPKEITCLAEEHKNKIDDLQKHIREYVTTIGNKSAELHNILSEWLLVLKELCLAQSIAGKLEDMFDAIKEAYKKAERIVRDYDLEQLRTERENLNNRIRSIQSELNDIEEALKRVEELVIKDASIIATTLTRAYLKDSIQSRRFDTVILDEASMAPIPALWIAASIADKNAVVVGDWKQLPPIVLSTHALSKKWLGQDIFEVAGLTNNFQHSYLIDLKEQYRMQPDISSIPNELIYQGMLEDNACTTNLDGLANWYRTDWGYDTPVLLVDTSSVGAWVTSVPRVKGSSRLNFLSATMCIDIVEHILDKDREKFHIGNKPRILITCPYRPHAKLLELLIREQGLEGEVRAGTTHSFQGSEAEVVILDLVNDEPHWKVAMFMPSLDKDTKRLLNVALTRARCRLIIVGDFEYIGKCAKKAFIGARLLPFLLDKFPRVDALDIIKTGLAARAVKAQEIVYGGEVEPPENRIVVTHEHFFHYLRADFNQARFRIIVYSPFMTENRIAQLEPQIRAAIERGVRIYIVTKAHEDRSKREISQYRMLENTLTEWGAVVVHKQRMHEKLLFIDDAVLWEGSLNPLSFMDTEEHMERRVSKKVFSDYAHTLHLNDLIGEYDNGIPHCPICGEEVVACEGKDEPFYWRCVEKDCYTRSIDQPALQGGIINCNRCAGKVEYGEWGGKPAWRCLENRRHHQRIARTHVRLPKMRAIIPKRYLSKLDRMFNIRSADSTNNSQHKNEQQYLFE